MDLLTADRLRLPTTTIDSFAVAVAGEEKIEGAVCCKGIKVWRQGIESETNSLIVPLGEFQIMLGTV